MTGREKRVRRARPPSAGPKRLSPPITNPHGFTLIELLVVISIIALLMAVLLPTLHRVRKQAKAVACQARVRQWGLAFKMYTDGNEGRWFTAGRTDDGGYHPPHWFALTWPARFNTRGFTACPMATRSSPDGRYHDAFTAWWWTGWSSPAGEFIRGPMSYGFNNYACWPPAQDPRSSISPRESCWGTCDVKGAAIVPVLFDSAWECGYPNDATGPPLGDVHTLMDIRWAMCINRHDGGINMLFMDWSVRKVGLKELWTFKWHKLFNTAGPWTRQGGVEPEDWPVWMRKYEDY